MTTPFFALTGAPVSVTNAATEFVFFQSFNPTFSGIVGNNDTSMPIGGTVDKLYFRLNAAPGAGTSWTLTLYKNGSATALTCTISDAATSNSDLVNSVSFVEGDLLAWGLIPTSSPTVFTGITASVKLVATTSGESLFSGGGNTITNSATEYRPVWGNTTSEDTTEAIISSLMPTAGVVDKLYVELSGTPGSGKSYAFTLYKNGSPTALTCTISDLETAKSDTTHSVSFTTTDTLSVETVPTGTPSSRIPAISMRMVPTTSGESIVSASAAVPSNTATRYLRINGNNNNANATEPITQSIVPVAATQKKMYVSMSTAPNTGNTRTTNSRVSTGSAGNLTVAIIDANTSGNDITHTDTLAAGDFVDFELVPASTPDAVTWYKVATVMYIAPAGGSSIKTFNGLAYASTKTVLGLSTSSMKSFNGLQ